MMVQTRESRDCTRACAFCLCPLSSIEGLDLPLPSAPLSCRCGEPYCSEACLLAAWASEHAPLCPAVLGEGPAEAVASLWHLLRGLPNIGEAFEAAVRLLALAVRDLPEVEEDSLSSARSPLTQTGERFWDALAGLAAAPWWETLGLKQGGSQVREAQELTSQVLRLLQMILPDRPPLRDLGRDELARVVGQVRMNAIEVVVQPAEAEAGVIDGPPLPEPVIGISMHLVASAANHACVPSCTVQGSLPGLNGWAVLQAVRPLAEGEEATISYTALGPETRQELREQWLFDCDCRHCGAVFEE